MAEGQRRRAPARSRSHLPVGHVCGWASRGGSWSGARQFEGRDNLNQTSTVRCVLDAYGPTRFDLMDAQDETERPTRQPPVVTIIVGGGRRAGRRRTRRHAP